MTANVDEPCRPRWWVTVALVVTIALGLLSRRYPMPGILAEYAGDALYAAAAFWGFAWLARATTTVRVAALAFLACAIVEFSQLLSWPWLQELRATTVGALLLGQGFKWPDLIAYASGVCAAGTVDRIALRRHVL